MSFLDPVTESFYTKLTLDIQKYAAQVHIDADLLRTQVDRSVISDHIAATLVRSVASFGRGEITYPATWWDGFKEKHFPAWAKKRWPVEWVKVEAIGLLPELPLPFKDKPQYTVVGSFLEPRSVKSP